MSEHNKKALEYIHDANSASGRHEIERISEEWGEKIVCVQIQLHHLGSGHRIVQISLHEDGTWRMRG